MSPLDMTDPEWLALKVTFDSAMTAYTTELDAFSERPAPRTVNELMVALDRFDRAQDAVRAYIHRHREDLRG